MVPAETKTMASTSTIPPNRYPSTKFTSDTPAPTAAEKMEAQLKKVYILVMGLNGVGKSTYIWRLTGDPSIEIGKGLESCLLNRGTPPLSKLTDYRHEGNSGIYCPVSRI